MGAIALYARDPMAFDQRDAAGLQLFGVTAGTPIENFRRSSTPDGSGTS